MTQVTLHTNGKTLTAKLSGEIDHHWATVLRRTIDDRVTAETPKILILDFAAVTFMDSAGIGHILARNKQDSTHGGVVVVQKAPAEIQKMLALAGIDAKE